LVHAKFCNERFKEQNAVLTVPYKLTPRSTTIKKGTFCLKNFRPRPIDRPTDRPTTALTKQN
jgi:hypothetical protein